MSVLCSDAIALHHCLKSVLTAHQNHTEFISVSSVSVFGSVIHTSDRTERPVDIGRNQKSHGKINVLKKIDSVPSNVQSSRQEALLYVFEDNEAVIKMIIKGRSPTMRHVSRTHRVALDCGNGNL